MLSQATVFYFNCLVGYISWPDVRKQLVVLLCDLLFFPLDQSKFRAFFLLP